MKISPILINPIKCHISRQNKVKSFVCQQSQTADTNFYCYMPFLGSNKNLYTPVSDILPDYQPLNCDYSNLDEFSRLFAQKINSQIRMISPNNIEALYQRIKEKTAADESLIYRVLYNLTLFSSYSSIDFIQKIINKFEAIDFGIQEDWAHSCDDISSNAALKYLSKNKGILEIQDETTENKPSLVVLDGILLKQLEYSKKHDKEFYKLFLQNLEQNKIKLINILGWDVECSDGRYRSTVFLYGTGQLEDLAVDVIKRKQKGETLTDIFYNNIENKLRNIIGDDLAENKIKIQRLSPHLKTSFSKQDIYKNLKTPSLNAKDVKKVICSFLTGQDKINPKESEKIGILTKYLDETSSAYSFDTIACELRLLHKLIKNKYGENVIYFIAQTNKSTSFISHLYAKINNIPPEKFFSNKREEEYFKKLRDKKPATIILDDISASGKTVEKLAYTNYWKVKQYSLPLSFALLCATDSAIKTCDEDKTTQAELIYSKTINDIYGYRGKLLSEQDLETLKKYIITGYKNIALSVVFPYLIPDNSSDLSGKVFKKLLIKDNERTNKAPRQQK